jgi:hypothetical protein
MVSGMAGKLVQLSLFFPALDLALLYAKSRFSACKNWIFAKKAYNKGILTYAFSLPNFNK